MRSVLGQLRRSDRAAPDGGPGLGRLDALRDAVTAAGAAVTVSVEGEPWPLPAHADHSAYRILQESLTNVLRHAGPGAAARVCLRYQPEALTITVTDNGPAEAADGFAAGDGAGPGSGGLGAGPGSGGLGAGPGSGGLGNGGHGDGGPEPGDGGHGICGMRERAVSAGGELTAGPLPGGGFQVIATLPAPSGEAP